MNDRREGRARRVVVPVHAFGELRQLLRGAARLAASLHIDLTAVLVEDQNLRRMAAFPFIDQISLATARRLPLEAQTLDREIAAFARLAASTLAEAAREAGVTGTLEIVHGEAETVLRAAAAPGDLMMIGARTTFGPVAGSRRLAMSAISECWGCDLLLHELRAGIASRIVVGHDGSEIARRALDMAVAVAAAYGVALTVIDLDHNALNLPAGAAVRRLPDLALPALDELLHAERAALLVMPAPLADHVGAAALVQASPCAVMIVR